MSNSPFHAGETAIQSRLGVKAKMEAIGKKVIRTVMPEQHRSFYENLPMMFLGSDDSAHNIWATAVYGESGFIQSPDPKNLRLFFNSNPYDPLLEHLHPNKKLGMLGLEWPTRRRNRVNGLVDYVQRMGDTIRLDVNIQQSFGNCPKYIHQQLQEIITEPSESVATDFTVFDDSLKRELSRADTFFIASAHSDFDVSHRGGAPGFILIEDDYHFVFPDYSGNNFFNTLGNLSEDARTGILLVDFKTGSHIYLTGEAEILWDETPWPTVERAVRFRIKAGKKVSFACPYRTTDIVMSPFIPAL
ncbi:pyridoxamine 5'-phosphate oxidase family protein [Teredinibacter purpureus]|uniref:pyridoxamine 5'-phosphate oxidase family protein n=1 Tax=Teredinibacter purpureus TaxID=2731756 RepID=UPI0005F82B64|nr:pyridoxamine 5'-phosphate oxidase family protein [Teredinibacter purpureus]